jgi:hypothetical protein
VGWRKVAVRALVLLHRCAAYGGASQVRLTAIDRQTTTKRAAAHHHTNNPWSTPTRLYTIDQQPLQVCRLPRHDPCKREVSRFSDPETECKVPLIRRRWPPALKWIVPLFRGWRSPHLPGLQAFDPVLEHVITFGSISELERAQQGPLKLVPVVPAAAHDSARHAVPVAGRGYAPCGQCFPRNTSG